MQPNPDSERRRAVPPVSGDTVDPLDLARSLGAAAAILDMLAVLLREILMTGCLAPEDVELLMASIYGDVAAARRGIGLKHWPPPVAALEQRLTELEAD